MYRFSLVGVLSLVLTAQAHATWADSLFEELSRDFGSVPRGLTVSHPFRVANNTKETVVISNVSVSCGKCSSARALQTVLAPGQETAVVVTMNTGLFANTKTVNVFVQFSQPRFAEVRLLVQANSREDVSFSSEAVAFGRIKRGQQAEASLSVTFYGAPTMQISEAKCDSNYVQTAVEEVRREGSEVVYKINGKLRPDIPPGKWYTDIWLKTNNLSMPKLRVPVTVEVESALAITPSSVALGKVKAGSATDRIVILRGVKAFKILEIGGTDARVRVRQAAEESKNVHVLTVTLLANDPGELNRTIRIRTDLKSGGEIEFTAQAEIVP